MPAARLIPHDRRAGARCSSTRAVPERPGRYAPRAQPRCDPASVRRARAHRRRDEAPTRHEAVQAHLDPARLRRRRIRRRALAAEAARGGRADPRRRPDSRHLRALPRVHVDAESRPWGRRDRELRDARLRRLSRQRLLPERHAHAPVAHPRGSRGLVPELRFRRARRDGVSPQSARPSGHADGPARPEGRVDRRRRAPRLPQFGPDRA